ncbi:hypothetical protein VTJ04DRAFT_6529 [Mycothermus thermophilus]|uniref:uncharacterized protein n=1 Tax=Humicola insolens TaxID=85995 RepID=UPI003743EFDC
MKTSTLLTSLLTITATSAATVPVRSPPTRVRDSQHRLVLLHTLAPVASVSKTSSNLRLAAAGAAAASTDETPSTKGGAILTTNQRITTAETIFRVPSARVPTHGPTGGNPTLTYAASFWLGIDSTGSSSRSSSSSTDDETINCGASLRVGVDTFWDLWAGGATTPVAWYQFAPGQPYASGLEGFSVAEGDVVRVRIEVGPVSSSPSDDAKRGVVVENQEYAIVAENFGNVTCSDDETAALLRSKRGLEKLSPVVSVRKVLPAPAQGQPQLCGREVAWMVEDFPLAGMPYIPLPLANFTSVEFAQAKVTLEDGTAKAVEKDGEGVSVVDINMEEQGGRLTKCEVLGSGRVRCDRVVGDE